MYFINGMNDVERPKGRRAATVMLVRIGISDPARCHSLVGWRDRESRRCHGLIKTVKAVLPKGKDERHVKNIMAKIRHLIERVCLDLL